MDPIIKWPGGKSRELKIIKDFIPEFNRYFEPFFGGGAVGLELSPSKAYVNDIDSLLIQFYKDVKNDKSQFYTKFKEIIHDWRKIEEIAIGLTTEFLDIFPNTIPDMQNINHKTVTEELFNKLNHSFDHVFLDLKFTRAEESLKFIRNSLDSKISRVIKLQIKHEKIFSDGQLRDHLMTAIKAGYYTLIRNHYFNTNPSSASFYFIREFCYGSMFRFNSKGEFNIPYGGINYNTKDIESKFQYLKSSKVQSILDNFEFNNLDFEIFFDKYSLKDNDFIFLDPPYDSDFKNYGKNPFTSEDQERLASYLTNCHAKWLLVIQRSDLIWQLYDNMRDDNSDISILAYDKKYTYNVRGRNDRDVSHLLIKNF